MEKGEYLWTFTTNLLSGRLMSKYVVVAKSYDEAISKGTKRFRLSFPDALIADLRVTRYHGDIIRVA